MKKKTEIEIKIVHLKTYSIYTRPMSQDTPYVFELIYTYTRLRKGYMFFIGIQVFIECFFHPKHSEKIHPPGFRLPTSPNIPAVRPVLTFIFCQRLFFAHKAQSLSILKFWLLISWVELHIAVLVLTI